MSDLFTDNVAEAAIVGEARGSLLPATDDCSESSHLGTALAQSTVGPGHLDDIKKPINSWSTYNLAITLILQS
jgi:hypothetical protein